jgi:hypothetical protein
MVLAVASAKNYSQVRTPLACMSGYTCSLTLSRMNNQLAAFRFLQGVFESTISPGFRTSFDVSPC